MSSESPFSPCLFFYHHPEPVFSSHPRALYFFSSSPGLTRGSKSNIRLLFYLDSRVKPENDSTFMLFTTPAGAPRPLWYSTFNPPRACRAGHPQAIFFIMSSPGTLFFLVIPGLDPGIQIKHKASLFIWILGSSPRMTIPLCSSQLPPEHRGSRSTLLSTRRAPAVQVIPGHFIFYVIPGHFIFYVIPGQCFFLVIPGLRPGDPLFKAQS